MQISNQRYWKLSLQELVTDSSNSQCRYDLELTDYPIWRLHMATTMNAAVPGLGPNYIENIEVCQKTNFEEIQSLFNATERMIVDHPEEIPR